MVWIDDKEYTPEEYEVRSRQESQERAASAWAAAEAKAAERREAERLVRKLGAAYTEYQKFLEAHAHLRGSPSNATGPLSDDQAVYEQLRRNLGHADDAPRCRHIKADGLACGSPRMKTGALCYVHQRMAHATSISLRLNYEDANSIQLSLMEVSRALVEREISGKDAGRLLYALQIAAANVDRVTFHQAPAEMVLEAPTPDPQPQPSAPETPCDPMDGDPKLFAIGDKMDRGECEQSAASPPPAEAVEKPGPVLHLPAVAMDPAHRVVAAPTFRDGS